MKSGFLNLHGRCNFRCKICMASDFNSSVHVPAFVGLKRQMLQAKRNSVRELGIGGGETTLYPRLFDLLDFAYQNKIRCVIGTNGFKLSDRDYVKRFVKYRPIGFKVSFHSHKKSVFDLTTGVRGSYAAVLRAIDNINELLGVYPVSKRSYLLANIVIHRHNFKDLPDIVKFLHRRRVYAVNLSQLFLSGRVYSNPGFLISLAKIHSYLEEAVAYLKKNNMFYYLEKFPVCIMEDEYMHFAPLKYASGGYIKFTQCRECRFRRNCWGVSKIELMARYGPALSKCKKLLGQDHFEKIFSRKDAEFIRKL